jgi:carbonic anhydrase
MSHLSTLLERNARFEQDRHRPLPIRPEMNTVVLSCLDARTDPAHFLGLAAGEAVVIRNAGGRVTPAVEQELGVLAAMVRRAWGAEFEIVLVHHTDCGMERLADPDIRAVVSAASSVDADALALLAISDHDTSLRDDLSRLRASSVVPKGITVTGLRYDPATGRADTRFVEAV